MSISTRSIHFMAWMRKKERKVEKKRNTSEIKKADTKIHERIHFSFHTFISLFYCFFLARNRTNWAFYVRFGFIFGLHTCLQLNFKKATEWHKIHWKYFSHIVNVTATAFDSSEYDVHHGGQYALVRMFFIFSFFYSFVWFNSDCEFYRRKLCGKKKFLV